MGGFSGDLHRGLKDFWSVYDDCYAEMQVVLAAPLEDHVKFGPLMARQSKDERDAQSAGSRRTLAKAIETGDWTDYEVQLRGQGALYANLGIGFRDWYDVVRLVARYMVPKLTAAFLAEPDRLIAALEAQGELFDRAMAVIGEAYIDGVEAQLHESVSAARDVTEQKQAEAEVAETRNFLDNILQSSTKYSIIGKDLNRRILSWNEGASRNYGYAAAEIMGKDSSVLHTPEDIESGAVERLLAAALESGLAEGEFQRVRKDGSRFAASVVVSRRNDATGRPIGYLLMSNDISEKKQAEEQLKQASQYARSLIEASLDPLVTISPEGKITDVNEGSIKVTGVPREKLVGTDFSDYFTEPEKAREGYQQVFAKGFVTDYPLTIRHKDGRLTDVLYNASVYKDAAGSVLGVFAAARDVTEQKRAEAEVAEQRTKELERIAELERFQKLTVGRELKMIELKKEIEDLKALAPAGKPTA